MTSRIEITMHYFKWHKPNKPVIISIAQNANESMLCPVSAIVSFLSVRGTSLDLYFATHRTVLKRAVEFSGYDNKLYNHILLG